MTNLKEDSSEKHGQIRPATELVIEPDSSGARLGSLAKFNVSPQAIRTLPADFVKRHRVLPLEIHNGTIHVATAEPGNQRVIDDIRLLSGLEVQESVAPASEILEKILPRTSGSRFQPSCPLNTSTTVKMRCAEKNRILF